MEIKGEAVQSTQACTDIDMQNLWVKIFEIQKNLVYENINKNVFLQPENILIQQFMDTHCSVTKYLFQVKKCLSQDCVYCSNHPVRLPMEHFKKLSFVPLPLLHDENYAKFSALYGKTVDEKDCPSTKPVSFAAEVDKKRKAILVSCKVRCVMNCQECLMRIFKSQVN